MTLLSHLPYGEVNATSIPALGRASGMRIHYPTAFGLLGLVLLFIVYAVLVGVWEPFAGGLLK